MKKTIWHGSKSIIEKPVFGEGKPFNDYGLGFYCTESKELAKEWACSGASHDGFANKYELELDGLRILNLGEKKYTILNWLALLLDNRKINPTSAIAKKGVQYLTDHFLPDVGDYDIIIGYRADDSYFSFAKAFVTNTISLNQLSNAMRLGKLGEQIVLKSEKAFNAITFIGYETASSSEYYIKRKTRDEKARADYQKEIEIDDIDGIYMRDIIREEIKNDDPRL